MYFRSTVTVILTVDKLTLKKLDGSELTYNMDKNSFVCALKHQVYNLRSYVAKVELI